MIKIALDMMGGDNAPSSAIDGVINFFKKYKNDEVELHCVGNVSSISGNLSPFHSQKIKFHDTTQVVDYKDRPSRIIKTKPDSYMNVSINRLI